MSRIIDLTVTIEVDEDDDISLGELVCLLSEMEEVCAKNNYGLYDAKIYEDGDCLTMPDEGDKEHGIDS